MVYDVYAETENDLKLFLVQHNFTDVDPCAVQIIPTTECRDVSNDLLKIHKFKSNHSNDIMSVMTSDFFVNMAVDDAGNDLTFTLIFGEAILRRDIEIFGLIGDIIYNIPHAHIADFVYADVDESNSNTQSIKDITDMRLEYLNHVCAPCEDGCAYLTHESLHDSIVDGQVYPITIERYISTFTSLLLDEYN